MFQGTNLVQPLGQLYSSSLIYMSEELYYIEEDVGLGVINIDRSFLKLKFETTTAF